MESSREDFVIAIRSAFLKKETQQRFSLLGLIFFSIIFLILGSLDFKLINNVKSVIKEIVYRSSFVVSVNAVNVPAIVIRDKTMLSQFRIKKSFILFIFINYLFLLKICICLLQ